MSSQPSRARLRIGIDAHAIGGRQTGNERFTTNLIRALRAVTEHEFVLLFTDPAAERAWPPSERTTTRLLRPGNPLSRVTWGYPRAARTERLDVLLVQYVGPPVAACPVVAVVHDVAFGVYPEYYSRAERLWMPIAIPATMRRAAGVVTVSEFSKAEIGRLYRIPPDRITVAYDGVDPIFLTPPEATASTARDGPYLLAIGNLQPRKNLVTLLRGFRRMVEQHPEVRERLVIVGQRFFAADPVLAEAEDLVRAGRVAFPGYVTDPELVALLRGATALCYPSVYEGFGLPVVEAMAVGVPAIASDIPVMREVAGDAAILVSPDEPDRWTEALHLVSTDTAARVGSIERGRARAARYTWERSAERVGDALERAAVTAPRRTSGAKGSAA